ncbi:hypothetical protein PHYPSEUDO_005451 [Phytophthora pseudosyringae]|uniref:Uncharacterized protein n=1 Tax=Phytophthora pseudosyringae TaxID=221518 RepID=A0A8T1VR85_9STRA|nr:hypothetical protein PHYPSEUDO_005451 [Phytophthora pseudosyringae]
MGERNRSSPSSGNPHYHADVKRARREEPPFRNTSGCTIATKGEEGRYRHLLSREPLPVDSSCQEAQMSGNPELVQAVHPTGSSPSIGKPSSYGGLGLPGDDPAPAIPLRTRKELLAKRVVSPEEYLSEIKERRQHRAPCEPPQTLRGIPVPLHPGETMQDYEKDFRRWVYKRNETITSLRAQPMKERGFRCQFALDKVISRPTRIEPRMSNGDGALSANCEVEVRAKSISASMKSPSQAPPSPSETQHAKSDDSADADDHSSDVLAESAAVSLPTLQTNGKPKIGANVTGRPETLPSWAVLLVHRVQELETEVTLLRQDVHFLRAKAGLRSDSCRDLSCDEEADRTQWCAKSTHQASCKAENEILSARIHPVDRTAGEKKIEAGGEIILNSFIHDDISMKNLTPSAPSQMECDLEMRQLAKAYCDLNNQSTINETAIDDTLAYVKAIKEVDESQANENRNQIMKLIVSINQEKKKRYTALAALLVCMWSGEEETLLSLLHEDPSETHNSSVTHSELPPLSLQLDDKHRELETLNLQLNDQIQWMSELDELPKEQAARDRVIKNQRERLLSFLRGDENIRNLVKDSLLKLRRTCA